MKAIPTVKFPSIQNFNITGVDEGIVSLSKTGILCDPQYFKQNIPGALDDCYVRESVISMLYKAQDKLPKGYKLKVYDGYRPICVQQHLWDKFRTQVIEQTGLTDEAEIDFKTSFFVSKPSYDENKPSLHNTGGAVDVTIVDENGNELDMGTEFDDFSDRAWTNHFEVYETNETIRDNRRMLYWAMIEAGFTNLPSEWWHYDYGTKFWGYFKSCDALYLGKLGGIL